MSYIGNTPTQQNFVAGADQFSGNGSTVAFTLSRSVNTVFDIFVTVSNVPQDPFTAYTVAGNTLTFDGAPPSGTNNIDVVYRATNVQTFVPTPGVSTQLGLGSASAPSLTFIGDTNTGIYSPAADTIAFAEGGAEVARFDSAGNFGIGTSSPNAKLVVAGGQQYITNVSAQAAGIEFAGNANTPTTTSLFVGQGSDSNGFVYQRANAPLIFATNNTERMRLDASGNLGVGTTSPGGKLDVRAGTGSTLLVAADATNLVSINNWNSTSGFQDFKYGGSTHQFFTGTAGGGSIFERARIDSSGNLLVGTTSVYDSNYRMQLAPAAGTGVMVTRASGATHVPIGFQNSAGTFVGNIACTNTATTYITSSDYRLKENVQPMTGALAKVGAMKPCTYTWKVDGESGEGFIAHELAEVCPGAVSGNKDAVNEDGSIKPQGIDTSFLVATLTAAIQEQQAMIDEMKAEIAALKAQP